MSTDIPSQIHSELDGLDPEKQLRVLAFVRTLKEPPKGISGSKLKDFAGTLSEDDAKSMIEEIDAACERVDPHDW